jgi:hypothetical protein
LHGPDNVALARDGNPSATLRRLVVSCLDHGQKSPKDPATV